MVGTTIGVNPMGSFEEWSYRVRQPLLWLDRDDPCDSIATVRENDPSRDALLAVLLEWKRALGIRNSHTVQQIIARALTNMDFFSALMGVAANPAGNLSATYAWVAGCIRSRARSSINTAGKGQRYRRLPALGIDRDMSRVGGDSA
jgi:hypothetical protein